MNELPVDEADVVAELHQIGQEAAGSSPDKPGHPKPDDEPQSNVPPPWLREARLIASTLAQRFTPEWDVTDDVKEQWAEAFSEVLNDLMPGGFANIEHWGPYGKLTYATAVWVLCGVDPETLTIRSPRRKHSEDKRVNPSATVDGENREPAGSGPVVPPGPYRTEGEYIEG